MHRTQILLEDGQYERLREQSRASGTGIGELVRRAVDQTYGTSTVRVRLQALDESFGAASEDDFDGMNGIDYIDQRRRGLAERLRESVGE